MRGIPHRSRQGGLPELGLERVSWVRVLVGPHGSRCQVAGVAHRRPVLLTIPLRTAASLLAGGVPGLVTSDRRRVPLGAGAGRAG